MSDAPSDKSQKTPARPPIDFGSFVLGLASTALVHLGIAPDPETNERRASEPELARETIELLAMLQEKTRGNLNDEERRFLDSLLHDLRMQYLAAVKERETAQGKT